LSIDDDDFTGFDFGRFQGFQTGVERLEKTRFLIAYIVWNQNGPLLNNPIHQPNVFGEAASCRFKPRSGARAQIKLTLRKQLFPAIKAFFTGDVMVRGHPIPDAKTRNPGARRYHGAGKFVPEYPRRRNQAVFDLFEIRAADAAGMHADENLSVGYFGDRHCFHRDPGGSAINGRAHLSAVYRIRVAVDEFFRLLLFLHLHRHSHQITFVCKLETRSCAESGCHSFRK